jgi:hypothetical protein
MKAREEERFNAEGAGSGARRAQRKATALDLPQREAGEEKTLNQAIDRGALRLTLFWFLTL